MVEVLDTILMWLVGFWTLAAVFTIIKVTIIAGFIYLIAACIAKWGG